MKIYVVSVDGGDPRPLLPGDGSESAPFWSPDGTRIVFSGSPFLPEGSRGPAGLRILDLRTNDVSPVADSDGIWAAQWSPDGAYLVGLRHDFKELVVFDLATGRRETLASGVVHFANWSADGQYVYFERWGDEMAATRIHFRDRREEKLGTLKQFRRTIGPNNCWSGLTPDGSFLVLRDVGSQEVYELTLSGG
jgi:Tol biopolymer transport system component